MPPEVYNCDDLSPTSSSSLHPSYATQPTGFSSFVSDSRKKEVELALDLLPALMDKRLILSFLGQTVDLFPLNPSPTHRMDAWFCETDDQHRPLLEGPRLKAVIPFRGRMPSKYRKEDFARVFWEDATRGGLRPLTPSQLKRAKKCRGKKSFLRDTKTGRFSSTPRRR